MDKPGSKVMLNEISRALPQLFSEIVIASILLFFPLVVFMALIDL
jgi:hypothetical protein